MGWSWELKGGSNGNIVANVSRWAPQGESWGRWGGKRPREPDVRWKEEKMVTEASDEGVREKTVKEKSQDHSPWRWHPGDQEGLGMCLLAQEGLGMCLLAPEPHPTAQNERALRASHPRSNAARIVSGGETSKRLWEKGGGQVGEREKEALPQEERERGDRGIPGVT